MSQTITLIYDGEAFRLETPVEIEPNTRFVATSITEPKTEQGDNDTADDVDAEVYKVIESLVGTMEGPEDWSLETDHYLYGTPKHNDWKKNE